MKVSVEFDHYLRLQEQLERSRHIVRWLLCAMALLLPTAIVGWIK